MRKTRWLAAFFLPLFLVSFLQAQSLAELAKKEKERRAAVKGKPAATITSADVAKVKKRPAVETAAEVQAGEEAAAAGEAKAEEGAAPPAGAQAAEAAAAGTETAQAAAPPAVPPAKPAEAPVAATAPADAAKSIETRTAELRKAAEDKQQLVDLLTLKMNALYQEFYSLDNLKSRELVQAQISDTYDKLLKAEVEAKQASKDLQDHLSQAKKSGGQAIWIK